MKLWKKPKKQEDFSKEDKELFFSSYECYKERIFLKDTKRVRIERVRYKRAVADRDIDCFFFTYFGEDRAEIFKRLKSDVKDESARRKYLPIIYDYFYDGHNTYVIEEAVNGDTLQEKLDRKEVYEAKEVVRIAVEMCLALEALHKRGIIHMDIKPANIVEKQDESGYKLIDFNASILEEDVKGSREYPYTEGFEAPEHKKLGAACFQTDICSLGKTMYALLTGKTDFEDIKNHDYVRFGKTVVGIVKRSTDKDVTKRYISAKEMRHELQGKHVTRDLDDEVRTKILESENTAYRYKKEYEELQQANKRLKTQVKTQAALNVILLLLILTSMVLHII